MLTDVPGVKVGHWTDAEAGTGCTAVILPQGSRGGVDTGIAVVPTYRDPALLPPDVDSIVIKPDDGAGCLDTRLHTRDSAQRWWAAHEHGKHVLQPFVAGRAGEDVEL